MEILTRSERETFNQGGRLARRLRGRDLVLLEGEIGSGKTVFVKGLARFLGIRQEITSPTYVFMRSYRGKGFNLYHFDLYRMLAEIELTRLNIGDVSGDPDGIFVVEWPKLFPKNLFKSVRRVGLRSVGAHLRRISITEAADENPDTRS